jgi:hypothetical protein
MRQTAESIGPGFDRLVPYIIPGLFWLAAVAILLTTAILLPPDEDAAILFQYSHSLASSGVIAYNPADGPAEGATDFLFMVVIAIGDALGGKPYLVAAFLSACGLMATLMTGVRALDRNFWAILVFCVVLAAAPMNAAAAGGFSSLVIGALLLVTVLFAIRSDTQVFYLWGVLACLVRPDAIVPVATAFACRFVMLGGVSGLRSRSGEIRALALAAAIGVGYFLLRWMYFGELLPLPFMVKASCETRFLSVCVPSARVEAPYALLAFAAAGLAWFAGRPESRTRTLTVFLSLCLLPLIFYAHVTLAQNVGHRFFYPIYLGSAFLLATAMHGLATGHRGGMRLLALGLVFTAGLSAVAVWRDTPDWWRTLIMNRYMVTPRIAAVMRKELPHGSLGVTEAGNLAYLSHWSTIDVWGLNTRRYARRLIQPDDIARENFDVLAVHGGWPTYEGYLTLYDNCDATPETNRSWQGMIDNIMTAMCDRAPSSYDVWLTPYYSPVETAGLAKLLHAQMPDSPGYRYDAYFVRRGYPGAQALEKALQANGALSWDAYRERWCRLGVCR